MNVFGNTMSWQGLATTYWDLLTCCRWNSKVMTSANSLEDAAEHLQRNRAVVFEAETVCFNMFNYTDFLINS